MAVRLLLALALLAALAFGVWEVRRWGMPEGALLPPRQRTLRAWGLFFLLLCLGLCLCGNYHPPHTKRALIAWIQYWMLTTLAALPLVPLALLDWRENLRRLAESRRALFQDTLAPLVDNPPDPSV
jgi:hypothetical protein